MVLGSGVAVSAQKFLTKMAAASGDRKVAADPSAPAQPVEQKPVADLFIYSGPASDNRVALTFDDGPMPGVTERILDELKQRSLHATFFMIGQRAAAAPDLAAVSSPRATTSATIRSRMPGCANCPTPRPRTKSRRPGYNCRDHRSSSRVVSATVRRAATKSSSSALPLGHARRHVECRSRDWADPGEEEILDAVFRDTKAGAIIVCHDNHAQTANAVGPMLDGLLERGFAPVTMSKLMEG